MSILSVVAKYLAAAILLSTYKSLPGAYFVRFYDKVFRNLIMPLIFGKNTENIQKLQNDELGCFSYTKLSTYASLFECDFYLHKSNSTYFEELDISRTDLMTKIFQKLFLHSKRYPFVPVANVFTNFLKEIKPFQTYDVRSCVFCWDDKWIYIMSRFYINSGSQLASLSITKYVLKDGRKTIKPKDALEVCGLFNETVNQISEGNMELLAQQCGFHETKPLEDIVHQFNQI
ncbi:LANO_0E06458g1_1 [Lachancea nothofagi CBS 11611]|uniref:LANO_0E06458g1_1 n=1 Tax=Lachancea nothofagi CBS 11611 TaxID=1266666 RepID=A0A1G4JU69_9SACH|nr:LANO_0E06458g1_1 [Lachancea nothofagi CBS 11611]